MKTKKRRWKTYRASYTCPSCGRKFNPRYDEILEIFPAGIVACTCGREVRQ